MFSKLIEYARFILILLYSTLCLVKTQAFNQKRIKQNFTSVYRLDTHTVIVSSCQKVICSIVKLDQKSLFFLHNRSLKSNLQDQREGSPRFNHKNSYFDNRSLQKVRGAHCHNTFSVSHSRSNH